MPRSVIGGAGSILRVPSKRSPRSSMVISAGGAAPWTPADLASIIHWWKASEITGLSNTDPVSTWEDLVGSADFTGSGSTRPLYYTNSGDPYVEFDGTDDTMNATISALNDFTMVMVVERVSSTNFGRAFQATNFFCYQAGTFDGQRVWTGSALEAERATPAPPTGDMAFFWTRQVSDGAAVWRVNGSQTTDTQGTSASGTTLYLGSDTAGSFNGNIRVKEMFLCSSVIAPASSDFTDIETYLLAEYGVTL